MDGSDPVGTEVEPKDPEGTLLRHFDADSYGLPLSFHDSRPRYRYSTCSDIKEYLIEIEDIAGMRRMAGSTTIGMALYYAEPCIRALWRMNDSWKGDNWFHFKKDVQNLYPEVFGVSSDRVVLMLLGVSKAEVPGINSGLVGSLRADLMFLHYHLSDRLSQGGKDAIEPDLIATLVNQHRKSSSHKSSFPPPTSRHLYAQPYLGPTIQKILSCIYTQKEFVVD